MMNSENDNLILLTISEFYRILSKCPFPKSNEKKGLFNLYLKNNTKR